MTPVDWMTMYPDIHDRIVTKIVDAIRRHSEIQWVWICTQVDCTIAFHARATPLAGWVRLRLTHRDKTDEYSYRLGHEFRLQSDPFGISPSEPFYDHSHCVIDLHERNHETGLHSICVDVDIAEERSAYHTRCGAIRMAQEGGSK